MRNLVKIMSRIGKKPILIPETVEVKIEENVVKVKGPKGELFRKIRPEIRIEAKEDKILVSPKEENRQNKALWGLSRTLIFNMIEGVTTGFEKKLEIQGVGFKAEVKDGEIWLYVGFSSPVVLKIPQGIDISIAKNIITVSGIDKELVGQITATIRKKKPPEPYKGKGIRYVGEVVRRKLGKKAVTSS